MIPYIIFFAGAACLVVGCFLIMIDAIKRMR